MFPDSKDFGSLSSIICSVNSLVSRISEGDSSNTFYIP